MRARTHRLIGITALCGGILGAVAPGAAAAPTIRSSDADDIWNAAQTPTYVITAGPGQTAVNYELDNDRRTYRQAVASPATVELPGLAEGPHLLAAADTRSRGDVIVRVTFTIDRTPPQVQMTSPAEGAVVERGATLLASYSCEGAARCDGPVASGSPLDTSRVGTQVVTVMGSDVAGNTAAVSRTYTVLAQDDDGPPGGAAAPARPPATPTPPPASGAGASAPVTLPPVRGGGEEPLRPATMNTGALRPAAGARLRSLRPTLRWRARRGAVLYNVQIFRLDGLSPRKVFSAFPRRARLVVPAGRLRPGVRHVWRVWPFMGRRRGFTPRPLGISYFDVRSTARPGR